MGYRTHSLQCSAMMSFQRSDGLGMSSKKGVKRKKLRSDVTHARCSHVTYALKKTYLVSKLHSPNCVPYLLTEMWVCFFSSK